MNVTSYVPMNTAQIHCSDNILIVPHVNAHVLD